MSRLGMLPGFVVAALSVVWIISGTSPAAATSSTAAEMSPTGPVVFFGDAELDPVGLFRKPDFFISLIEPARVFTSSTGGGDPNDKCSAQPPGNHACSAIDYPAGEETCSVNGDGGHCSAQGGSGTQYCSTRNGSDPTIKCSVIDGEDAHCTCASTGGNVQCSASSGVPTGACSVYGPGGGTEDTQNSCSAYLQSESGYAKCSAFTSDSKCSVVEDAKESDVCTVMTDNGGQCSTFGSATSTNIKCSTMMNNGTVDETRGTDGKCHGRQPD